MIIAIVEENTLVVSVKTFAVSITAKEIEPYFHALTHFGSQAPIPTETIDMAQAHVEKFMSELGAREMAISGATHRRAIEAARTYGKFVAHPARLNLGDCFAYACAQEYRLPLLFKGDDFPRTDIELA